MIRRRKRREETAVETPRSPGLEAARQDRLTAEQELAVTEARRATEIRTVHEPLLRTRRQMLAENHVIEDIMHQLRQHPQRG